MGGDKTLTHVTPACATMYHCKRRSCLQGGGFGGSRRTTEFREGSATAAAMEGHMWFTLRMLLPAVRMRHLLACASSLLVNLV